MMDTAVDRSIREEESNKRECSQNYDYLLAAARDGLMDLEQAADTILAAEGALSRENGIFTQAQLTRRIRIEQQHLPLQDEDEMGNEVIEYLVERQVADLVDVSNLTPMQEICFKLYVDGLTCKDISIILRLRFHKTAYYLRTARQKVQEAIRDGRYAGWYEVYLSEVNRYGHRGK